MHIYDLSIQISKYEKEMLRNSFYTTIFFCESSVEMSVEVFYCYCLE